MQFTWPSVGGKGFFMAPITSALHPQDFLNVIRSYRLSTEQASTLKSVAYAFAYAEEFTCYPPTVFMIFVTFIETAFFIYHVVHLPGELFKMGIWCVGFI